MIDYDSCKQIGPEKNRHKHIEEKDDTGFTDYESALKCTLFASGRKFAIGGVVLSVPHPRITLINSFVCEFEVEGTILATTNQDRAGMVGVLGSCLGKNGVNIDQFQLSRNTRGGAALSLIRVDDDLPDSVVEQIKNRKESQPLVKSFCNEFKVI